MAVDYTCRMPAPGAPMVDVETGVISHAWWHWALAVFKRTGDAPGIGTVDAETLANAAQAAAAAASGAVSTEAGVRAAADTANASAITTEATTRAAADTAEIAARNAAIAAEAVLRVAADAAEVIARNTAIGVETSRATAAEALLAPKATPVFTTSIQIDVGGPTWTEGAAAPSSTQPIGSLYSRAGGAVGATLYVSRGGGTWAAVAGV
jgi:hypothetical protein